MDGQQLDEMDGGLLEEEHEEKSQNIIDKLVDLFNSSVITQFTRNYMPCSVID